MSSRLPGSVPELRGLRAARWIRESTAGQFDRYGPDVQREQQDRAIARLGLVDTGLAWSAAHSGSTVHSSPAMRGMLEAAAAGAFDVLVVARSDRWQRNLRQTLNLLEEDLHPAGVVVWFDDEELLSSNERAWDQLVDEAKGAESWLRKHRRRVKEGLAAKLREQRDPGGRPPFGFRRDPQTKFLEPDESRAAAARKAFELAAGGATDRAIATELELPLFTVRGILTSPLYAGRLRDGRPTRFAPMVPPATWEQAQAVRARRATSTGRPPAPRRPYALSRLHCAHCGARLTGDTGYYRHREPCRAFLEATPRIRRRRGRQDGKAYRREWYEAVVGALLRRVAIGSDVLADVVSQVVETPAEPDRFALARIERDREQALARYRRDRETAALEATMARLDVEESTASELTPTAGVPASVAAEVLRDVASAWDELVDRPGTARRQLADAIFERVEVSGFRSVTVTLTAHARAHGFDRVIPRELTFAPEDLLGMVGARGLSPILSKIHVRIAGQRDLTVVRVSRSA